MRVKTIEDKERKYYYNEEISDECIEINIHLQNWDDLIDVKRDIDDLIRREIEDMVQE